MELEKIARKYVQGLKCLYVNISVYLVVSVVSMLAWLSFGGHGFWPIWVFLAFGMAIILQGWTIGSIKKLEEFLPFLRPEWEEEHLKKLLKQPVSSKINAQDSNSTSETAVATASNLLAKMDEVSSPIPKVSSVTAEKKSSHSAKSVSPSKISKSVPKKKVVSQNIDSSQNDGK